MAIFSQRRRSAVVAAISLILLFDGCSTTQIEPLPEFPAEPPPYVRVPHPQGLDLGDVRGLFSEKGAPERAFYLKCDQDFLRLREVTQSKVELDRGIREFVKRDPVKYHWCFYSKVLELEDELAQETYIDERQKSVVDHYLFLTPVARSFMSEFRDSRYLRWAVTRYRRVSEFIFYRKVEATPQLSSELIQVTNPFAELRPNLEAESSVLEKYGLIAPVSESPPVSPPATVSPFKPEAREVAPALTHAPTAVPGVIPPPSPSFGEDDRKVSRTPASDQFNAREIEKDLELAPN